MPLQSVNMKCELEIVDRTQSNQNNNAYLQPHHMSSFGSEVLFMITRLNIFYTMWIAYLKIKEVQVQL